VLNENGSQAFCSLHVINYERMKRCSEPILCSYSVYGIVVYNFNLKKKTLARRSVPKLYACITGTEIGYLSPFMSRRVNLSCNVNYMLTYCHNLELNANQLSTVFLTFQLSRY
jgi:hypothetical protein